METYNASILSCLERNYGLKHMILMFLFLQATKWFNKALDTVDVLMNGVDAGCFYKYVETKGNTYEAIKT